MAVWKILVIGVLACTCLALALGTVIVALPGEGGRKWLSAFGLLAATGVTGGLFALFLRYAGQSLDLKPSRARN
jgi:hypothetical protein